MSTSKSHPSQECKHPDCTTLCKKWEFDDGRYCSTECRVRHEGRQKLAGLKYDHQRCFTCFRFLKDINPPKPDFEFTERGHGWAFDEDGEPTLEFYSQEVTRSAAMGFQFLTGNAIKGEKQRGDRVITGTICERCGATDHTDHDPTLGDREAIGRLVSTLIAEEVEFDIEQLHREYTATDDLELAMGRALDD